MSRYDLTDFEWRVIEPLLPNKPRGVRRGDQGASAATIKIRIGRGCGGEGRSP